MMEKNTESREGFKNGLIEHPLHGVWVGMKYRCKTKRMAGENWGHRGIRVCEEWQIFTTFYTWSINNGYKKGLSLDRIDNDGNYRPENCRWINWSVQNKNKRRYRSMPRHNAY